MEVIVDRAAGLDVHQKTVMAAIRTPGPGQRRHQEIRQFSTYTEGLVALRGWLVENGVTLVVMEATGVYWKPVWHVLEDQASFELELVNPRHVKNLSLRSPSASRLLRVPQRRGCPPALPHPRARAPRQPRHCGASGLTNRPRHGKPKKDATGTPGEPHRGHSLPHGGVLVCRQYVLLGRDVVSNGHGSSRVILGTVA